LTILFFFLGFGDILFKVTFSLFEALLLLDCHLTLTERGGLDGKWRRRRLAAAIEDWHAGRGDNLWDINRSGAEMEGRGKIRLRNG
jgi:hypothetical protein